MKWWLMFVNGLGGIQFGLKLNMHAFLKEPGDREAENRSVHQQGLLIGELYL